LLYGRLRIVKQNVSPAVVVSVLAVVVIILGVLVFRTIQGPSSVVAPNTGGKAVNPREGGGPTEEAIKRAREYNAAHPEAAARSSIR
jgi:hypothetical protein